MGFPPIDSYAFLSDTHTAALVAPDGAVEWFCVPHFDGDAVLARLLDRATGGTCTLAVDGAGPSARRYLPETLVLENSYAVPGGTAVGHDFLAVAPGDASRPIRAAKVLVRRLTVAAGTVRVALRIEPRPGYGAEPARWERAGGGWQVAGVPLWVAGDLSLHRDGAALVAAATLTAGQSVALFLGYGGPPVDLPDAGDLWERTCHTWRGWSGRSGYAGHGRDLVRHSALVLRGLAFDETGALLAAPTTSLPEEIGGVRNWDYRYTWHRDAALLLLALFRLGHGEEGRRYLRFLLHACGDGAGPAAGAGMAQGSGPVEGAMPVTGGGPIEDAGPAAAGRPPVEPAGRAPRSGLPAELAPLIGIRVTTADEQILPHLGGYADSRPVRIGNAAAGQTQFDTYGHVLDAALAYQQLTGELTTRQWAALRCHVDTMATRWHEPDHGIWEVRGPRRHYVNSKVLAWVCLDRGIRLAGMLGDRDAPVGRWERARAEVRADILRHGYDDHVGSFVLAYGSTDLDASLLRIPLVGFLRGDDPRMLSTLDRIQRRLALGPGLIRRYDAPDGLPGTEGAFLLCSFELVSALVLAGRQVEAGRLFDRLCQLAGPLGLYAEQVDADGTALGNYPQAFTHLALIEAALNLDRAGDTDALHAWAARGGHGG